MQIPAIRYSRDTTDFTKTLRARVDAYFKENNLSRKGDWRLHLKTAAALGLYFVPWALITWGLAGQGWMFWVAELVMGLGLAGIGLNVMHDANHDAYSNKKWVNLWVGRVLDLVGGNAMMWKIQHNVLHHTFTNIDGLDEDIDPGPVLRFSPLKPLKPWHRFQHYYAWFFYGLMTLLWVTIKDFIALNKYEKYGLLKRMGKSKSQLMTKIILAKVVYYPIVVGLPLMFSGLGAGQVIAGWLLMHFVGGLTLGIIFQPAHVMEDHDYVPAEKGGVMEDDPMSHQLKTTCNFGTKSRLLNWYSGGLTHQIEHHLFPHVCHVHYPKISKIVRQTAEEFGLPYRADTSFWGALKLHTAQLRQLGRA